MFTGIIEATGTLELITAEGSNLHLEISSPISHELKVDQSVAHNGICLTVTETSAGKHQVTAVNETIAKTSISRWVPGMRINLERCMQVNARLDGHLVQGHVDTTGVVKSVVSLQGSHEIVIDYLRPEFSGLLVLHGSVCVNGISLTVAALDETHFKLAIIPYTWEHTDCKNLKAGDSVNIEFDILGKYILRNLKLAETKN
jgi:riboflavin synthase